MNVRFEKEGLDVSGDGARTLFCNSPALSVQCASSQVGSSQKHSSHLASMGKPKRSKRGMTAKDISGGRTKSLI
jgi:hypothetical protein